MCNDICCYSSNDVTVHVTYKPAALIINKICYVIALRHPLAMIACYHSLHTKVTHSLTIEVHIVTCMNSTNCRDH